MNEHQQIQSLKDYLTRRLVNIHLARQEITDKELKEAFCKLVSQMEAKDELWEWEWFDEPDGQGGYSLGWCILRGEVIVDSYCHSF